jgi:phosphate/phosphite/phosphonate ABC transporter binding protein
MKMVGLLCLLAVGLSGCGGQSGSEADQPRYGAPSRDVPLYRFAILPLHNPTKSYAVFGPLIDYLQARIPEARFVFESSQDFPAFERKLRERQVAFALPNPYETLLAERHGYRVFAKVGRDADFRGIFVARRDSGITQVADLQGKVVAYPAPTALAAALQAQYFLQTHGLDVNRDVENRYVGSQDSSILAVYYRQADAGATWPPTWRVFLRSHPREASELEVVWETPSLPNLPFVVRDDVPPELVGKVTQVLLHMGEEPDGRAVLERMEFDSIVAANGHAYDPVRRFVRDFDARVRPIEGYEAVKP